MEAIRMVDLKGQYLSIKDEIDAAIKEVIDAATFIKGPQVEKFEEEMAAYLDVNQVIGCANGTDALMLALKVMDLEPGDEVITSPFSFISTIEVIQLLRLVPVLVDIKKDTFNIDPAEIERNITDRTRAIIPVHLFGQCANMSPIQKLAKEHDLFVIEDAAQSLGADYIYPNGKKKKSGTIGDIGCTSFFPSKNLGCYGDGGALFTDNEDLARKIRSIANHGMKERYYYEEVGVNSRLDSLQAAILSVKLKYLDAYGQARQEAAAFYDEHLDPISCLRIPSRTDHSNHIYHQYSILLYGCTRDGLKKYLQEHDIPSAIYYPVPLHLQQAYKDLKHKPGDFPVAEQISESILSLPMHTELTADQLEYICKHIQTFTGYK